MNIKKLVTSVLIIILVFLCLFIPKSKASFFFDDDQDEISSTIDKTIDEDEGRII